MNRRDFAKGIAALPFIGSVKSFASICGENHYSINGTSYLLVILEGPFALVIGNGTPYTVTAFTPRHDGRHLLAFNGQVCSADAKYGFRLLPEGLAPANDSPGVYGSYPGFCAENTPCQQSREDHFVSIDLPVPQAIIMLPSRYTAKMESKDKFEIPGGHVLVYQLKDENAVKIYGSEGNDIIELRAIKLKNLPVFRIEVGLPNLLGKQDSDPDGSHAIDFYNSGLLSHFSELAGDKTRRIKEISTHPLDYDKINRLLGGGELGTLAATIFTTTTFECKIGGLTATSP